MARDQGPYHDFDCCKRNRIYVGVKHCDWLAPSSPPITALNANVNSITFVINQLVVRAQVNGNEAKKLNLLMIKNLKVDILDIYQLVKMYTRFVYFLLLWGFCSIHHIFLELKNKNFLKSSCFFLLI